MQQSVSNALCVHYDEMTSLHLLRHTVESVDSIKECFHRFKRAEYVRQFFSIHFTLLTGEGGTNIFSTSKIVPFLWFDGS